MQGLVFKWGSLVGMNMVSNYTSSSVVFTPEGFSGSVSSWDNVPYANETIGLPDTREEDAFVKLYGSSGFNAASGKGDICRYMSAKGMVSGKWRMPTYEEMYVAVQKKEGDFTAISSTLSPTGEDKISSGYTVGSSPATVFFPAGGRRYARDGAFERMGTDGYYWACSSATSGVGYGMRLYSSYLFWGYGDSKKFGYAVRCVLE